MTSAVVTGLQQMLSEMDAALVDEIKAQSSKNSGEHVAVGGKLVIEHSGHYIYSFSLKDPWEPDDDTPIRIKINGTPSTRGTIVTSNGTMITIATEEVLPPEALREIAIINDATELLERLREALGKNDEGEAKLGSKSFGLLPFNQGKRLSPVTFGNFCPDESQKEAIEMALGSQVMYLVGPPGTGKTSTLAAMAFAYLREGRTVLITAHTNIAVDNAIMKLADICQEAGASAELWDGHVVRYGTPQHKSLIEDNKYEDIYLPKIIKRRGSDLYQQRVTLKASLAEIEALALTVTRDIENWQKQRSSSIMQHNRHQEELDQLQAIEQQRIASLDVELRHLTRQLQQTQQHASAIYQKLVQMAAQQVQIQTARIDHLRLMINDVASRVAETQQISSIKRFFKCIDPKQLEKRLVDTKQQIWDDDQALVKLKQQMDVAYSAYAEAESQLKQLAVSYHEATIQRNMPFVGAARAEILRNALEQYDQYIAYCDGKLQKKQTDMQQKEKEIERIKEQMAVIDQQIMDLEKNIVAEARVVGTTLSKIYMNKSLCERHFDIVILDEVSMAPLPAVYIAASHATSSVVAIGDPHQLAPIVTAGTAIAEKWLGRDLFALTGVNLDCAARRDHNSILLTMQSRMHPDISVIARKHVYKGLIDDRKGRASDKFDPLPDKPLVLCDTSEASPLTTHPKGGSRINIYHALCVISLAQRVLNPPDSQQTNMHNHKHYDLEQTNTHKVGLVTPYRKQAELLQQLIKDAGLQDLVRAGTVHRFQGLEFEVVIFDTVESKPSNPVYDFTAGGRKSNAMRLINVAVTRPKHKLIIVANANFIRSKLDEEDTLYLAVQEAQKSATIKSNEVLGIKLPPLSDALGNILQDHEYKLLRGGTSLDTGQYELKLLDENTFFPLFEKDMYKAERKVVIFSPFLTPQRTAQIKPILDKLQSNVHVTVFTKPIEESNKTAIEAEPLLNDPKIERLHLTGMHEKIVLIDEEIVYIGSLNVLSHRNTTEIMLRVKSSGLAKEISKLTNRNKFQKAKINTEVEDVELKIPDIEIPLEELPRSNSYCKRCGAEMVAKIRRADGQPFYSCKNYHTSGCKSTEDAQESHLASISLLTSKRCEICGGQTRVRKTHKHFLLECVASATCKYQYRIRFK